MTDDEQEYLTALDFENLFSEERGKRVLEQLSNECDLKLTLNPDDPIALAKLTGRREMYWKIIHWIERAGKLRKHAAEELLKEEDDE